MKNHTVTLTITELEHLISVLHSDIERGDYYGNRAQYDARAARILAKLEASR
jgi:hypothetical protein